MQKLVNIWTSRALSLKGKITIIRSLILPQIQFLFSMVFVPQEMLQKLITYYLSSYGIINRPKSSGIL